MNSPASSAVEILQERARLLARVPPSAITGTSIEVLEFRIGRESYAAETRFVREVYPLKELTSLPGAPTHLLGIVNVRGSIVPVYDLRRFFDLPEQGITDLHRIIIVHNAELELGLLADTTVGVRTVPVKWLHPPLPTLTGVRGDYLKGVTAERLIVLDLTRVLADPTLIIDDKG
jgi:purine-binding chemotaxis protein CheW